MSPPGTVPYARNTVARGRASTWHLSRHTPMSCSPHVQLLGENLIEDEVLVALVPPLMQRAQEGPEAWESARTALVGEFESRVTRGEAYRCCVIAHYVALLTRDDAERLAWNRTALAQSEAADPGRVRSFLPSLNASIGASYFDQGDRATALYWYERAHSHVDDLPPTPYGDKLRSGIASRLAALQEAQE